MAKAVKLSEELIEVARREGQVMYRSIGAQVEYWAKIGDRSRPAVRWVQPVYASSSRVPEVSRISVKWTTPST